jgi:FliI/YscN family ATPase
VDPEALKRQLEVTGSLRAQGQVQSVVGLSLRLVIPGARVGDLIEIQRRGQPLLAEIVGFEHELAIAMPLGNLEGVGPNDPASSTGGPLRVPVGTALLGRVIDAFGRPIDDRPLDDANLEHAAVVASAPPALARRPIDTPLPTGVRVLDALITLGEGQRVGLFAGSGVGKSTLLGAIAQGVEADVVVVALVGERGREVTEFIEDSLADALPRSVVVVATSDSPPLERLKAAMTATAVAEHFRDAGKRVMLMVDSITRFARAQREVGLASGEPPARRGYPPSVFAALPRLLERTGQGQRGSITALYTVLVEGSDMEEPIADEVRSILDGHVVLDREVASRGWYPAVSVSQSLSRVMPRCTNAEHQKAAKTIRRLLGAYDSQRDMIQLGAYKKGSDRDVDQALAAMPALESLLTQDPREPSSFDATLQGLLELASRYG